MTNPLAEEYELTCQHEKCGAVRFIDQVRSAGLQIGSLLLHSPSEPDYGRCLRCKRYSMRVTAIPAPSPPTKPEGFTRIPTS